MMDKTGDADALLALHLYCPKNTKNQKRQQLIYSGIIRPGLFFWTGYLSRSFMGVNHSKFLYLLIDVSQSFKVLLCKEKEGNK